MPLSAYQSKHKKYRAIIAEDEAPLALLLKNRLKELWPALEVVNICEDGLQALSILQNKKIDIAFLDISMPFKTGIEVAEQCLQNRCPTLLVLVTAYPEYALQAFEFNICDYLVKPLNIDRLKETIKRLQTRLQQIEVEAENLQYLNVQKGTKNQLLQIQEVAYFSSDQKYTKVVCQDNTFLIRKTLTELESELDNKQFWRIHRNSIVNIKQIKESKKTVTGRLQLSFKNNSDKLTVSRKYTHLFKTL